MHRFFIKTPWLVKKLFPSYVWSMPDKEKTVYLTFDDGPHPTITPFVLNQLKRYEAVATFFCIGANVVSYPAVYKQILEEGHAVGNHTYNHVNGWKVGVKEYVTNAKAAATCIESSLFRPPYGKIKKRAAEEIKGALGPAAKIIMWDVLSADFDRTYTPQQCLNHVLQHVTTGSIVVFHDSEKAFKNLNYILPLVLRRLKKEGYLFRKVE